MADLQPEALLLPLLAVLLGAALAVLVLQARARGAVGERVAADRGGRALRRGLVLGPLALVAAAVVALGVELPPLAIDAIAVAALVGWITPGTHEAVLGTRGVQHGLEARRFEDLAEWRLTGDHLRFRFGGDWLAAPAPLESQAALREALAAAAPGRESRFSE